MNKSIKSVLVLSVICFVLAIALAAVNSVTLSEILKNEEDAAAEALRDVYPDDVGFEKINLDQYTDIPQGVTEAYKFNDGGYAIKITTTGYNSGLVIMCGISSDGGVTGAKCVASNETPGIGGAAAEKYAEMVVGKSIYDIESVDTIAGATKTTLAYRNAVRDAIGTTVILNGGSFDNRSEHEIKLDEALPQANEEFETVFVPVEVQGLTTVYKAKNNTGYVFIFGETYIGSDNSGNVLTNQNSEYASLISENLSLINNVIKHSISLDGYQNVPESIVSAEKTDMGNYIITVNAEGYDAQNKYSQTKKPITIKIAISPGGKILCCETVEQYESKGYGAACAAPSYYTQYNGKNSNDYTKVDAIAGATITSNAYLSAVGDAIQLVKVLEGGM